MTTEQKAIKHLENIKKRSHAFGGLHLTMFEREALDEAIEALKMKATLIYPDKELNESVIVNKRINNKPRG